MVIGKSSEHEILTLCLFNPLTAKVFNWNFHPLELVFPWRDSQFQVGKKSDLKIELKFYL